MKQTRSITSRTVIPLVIVAALCFAIIGFFSFDAAAQKKGGAFKDQFTEHVGKVTNLGRLQEIGSDYIVTTEDQVTFLYQFSSIQGIRLENDEASGGVILEILLK